MRAWRRDRGTTARDLLMSKDEAVEKPGGQLGRCQCWWRLGGVTMAGFWAVGA